jgi:hypothetical protein
MKTDEVIELVSESQDNNALVNRSDRTDHLSDLIVNAIERNGDDLDHDDLEDTSDYLAYAIDQLKKAKVVVDRIAERVEY